MTYTRVYFGHNHELMGYKAANGVYIDREFKLGTWGAIPDGFRVYTKEFGGKSLYWADTLKEAKTWIDAHLDWFVEEA